MKKNVLHRRLVIILLVSGMILGACQIDGTPGGDFNEPLLIPEGTVIYPVPEPDSEGTVYDIGPEYDMKEIADMPWLDLAAGDLVRIHYREEPYKGIIALKALGTSDHPVRIAGVPDADGNLPVITGKDAAAGENLGGFFDKWTSGNGVIVIKRSLYEIPKYIEIYNLVLTGAYKDNEYTDEMGHVNWADGSAGIWLLAAHVTIKGCVITGNGNGILTQANSGHIDYITSDLLVEGCAIHKNGTAGSDQQHNLYIQSAGMTVQFCAIGDLRDDAHGCSLKDRSAGTVIRYNRIEAGARLLDLVDPDGNNVEDVLMPRDDFDATYVYGNILINDQLSNNGGCATLFHYGKDMQIVNSRRGTLNFYNNTVYINRSDSDREYWSNNFFEAEHKDANIRLWNNIFYFAPMIKTQNVYLIRNEDPGEDQTLGDWENNGWALIHPEGGNWINGSYKDEENDKTYPGWFLIDGKDPGDYGDDFPGDPYTRFIEGTDAGITDFANRDFSLLAGSPARNIGVPIPADVARPFYLDDDADNYQVRYQYRAGTIYYHRDSLDHAGAVE